MRIVSVGHICVTVDEDSISWPYVYHSKSVWYPLAIFSSSLMRIVSPGDISVTLNDESISWPYFLHP